ncbi:unnamed protein product [Bursaphelenchus okinawaensis]|uniref:Uncharacterized protein n=1 Tax=Bursaphelenchus okinawaensis TaxID=465554 RepID=A0A811L8T0_9BILA|nr:unnamed protein product [Bursaphelenchus okinawaensis]CAG9120131.1 unnamed protein product [Bursaphelenchus okinawaensis]
MRGHYGTLFLGEGEYQQAERNTYSERAGKDVSSTRSNRFSLRVIAEAAEAHLASGRKATAHRAADVVDLATPAERRPLGLTVRESGRGVFTVCCNIIGMRANRCRRHGKFVRMEGLSQPFLV